MAVVGSDGGRLDLKCRPGTRLGVFELAFVQDNGRPLDLQGYDVVAVCATRETVPVDKVIDVVVQTPPEAGKVHISMADDVTITLPRPLTLAHPPRVAADWGVYVVEPNGGAKVAELYGEILTEGVPTAAP